VYKSKLLEVYKAFSEKELLQLRGFVAMSAKMPESPIIKLFEILYKHRKKLGSKALEKEKAYAKIFDTPFNSKKMRMLMSSLLKVFERYAVMRQIQGNTYQYEKALGQFYKQKNLTHHYTSLLSKNLDLIDKSEYRGAEHFLKRFQLSHALFMEKRLSGVKDTLHLQEAFRDLELLYACYKLRYSSDLYSNNYFLNKDDAYLRLDHLLEVLLNKEFQVVPFIRIYQTFINAFRSKDPSVYDEIHNMIEENLNSFDVEEIHALLVSLLNYRMQTYRSGEAKEKEAALFDLYRIYKLGLQRDAWLHNDILPSAHFLNIVSSGCTYEDFDFLDSFLTKYIPKLEESSRESLYQYALARIEFSKKNFEKSLEILVNVEFVDIYLALQAKTLQLQSFYELEGYNLAMDNFLLSFNAFLKRNKKVYKVHKESYLNMISITRKLYRNKRLRKKPSDKLIAEAGNNNVAHRSWIKSKIEELS